MSGETFAMWFGGVWLVCGLPFLVLGIYFGMTDRAISERLAREGVSTEGMVLSKTIEAGRSRHDGSNPTPSYWVRFRFTTPTSVEIDGRSEVNEMAWRTLVERGPIGVRYVPSEPYRYRVDGEADPWYLGYIFAGVGLLMTAIGGPVLVYGIRHTRAVRRLVAKGVGGDATVSAIVPTRITINGEPQWRIDYHYEDERGRRHTGRSEPMSPDAVAEWQPGQRGRIRYDARVPERSAWLGRAS